MQPFLAVATLVAAFTVVNSETAYILQPIHQPIHHHRGPIVQPIHESVHQPSAVSVHEPRVLTSGWGWRPVKTVTLALPSISSGWGWKPKLPSLSLGVYGGVSIGPKQQGWGKQQQQGWGWQPPKQQGWGWQPPKQQQGWGWQPPKQQGWGWKQQGWGWDDDDDDEDDYRALSVDQTALADIADDASSEEVADDDASSSVESEEQDSAEADAPLDLRRSIVYEPYFA